MVRGSPPRTRWHLPWLLLILVLLAGCSAFSGGNAADPEPTSRKARNTVDAAAVGTRLTLTASVATVITPTSFLVKDADLPREGLLVLDGTAPVLRPSDLVDIDGDITLFSFADLAARYGLSDAAPYAAFERRKALVARTVRSWAEPSW